MKLIYLLLLSVGVAELHAQSNLYPGSGSVKIYAGDEAWAEGLCIVKPSSWSGIRLTRNDPTTGNYTGNWAIGYRADTGNDFDIINNEGTVGLHLAAASGFAGIGTLSPAARFHVTGTNANNPVAIRIENTNTATNSFAPVQFKTGISGSIWQAFARNADFNIGIADVADYFIIKNGGNVGIGTASPDQKLTVNGTVHATRVKVETTVPGPDYVFEKSYSLPTLDQVKAYIDENKHLPEIPSAKEMEAKGIDVGEMNMLLLKKVEELTLYVIEQNEKLVNQEQLIQNLIKEVREPKTTTAFVKK